MRMNVNQWQKVAVVAAGAALAYAAARSLRARPDTKTALGGRRGVHVRETLTVARPCDEVFAFWRDLSNLPRFMSHLERVDVIGPTRSHWVARGPGGTTVSWDAEVINEVAGELIGWQSLEGSTVATAGSVRFTPMGPDATQLHVHMQYEPPAGRFGAFVAMLFGEEPNQQVREDLLRLKTHLEGAPWRRG